MFVYAASSGQTGLRWVGISRPAIRNILRRVESRITSRRAHSVESIKAKQSGQLEFLLDEALRAWERSKGRTIRETRREGLRSRETVTERLSDNFSESGKQVTSQA